MIPFVEDNDPKIPLDDDGDPNGVEKEPTGLAKQDRVRRVPYKKRGWIKKKFVWEEKMFVHLDRGGAKWRVPPRGGRRGRGEVGEKREQATPSKDQSQEDVIYRVFCNCSSPFSVPK